VHRHFRAVAETLRERGLPT